MQTNNEYLDEWPVRPYSKRELAIAYAPDISPCSALNRLAGWVRHHQKLSHELDETGYVVCLHKIGVFQFIYRNKDTEKVRIRQRSDPLIFIFYHLIYPDFTPPLRDSFRRKPEVVHS